MNSTQRTPSSASLVGAVTHWGLERFLALTADLYATNPAYAAELEAERETNTVAVTQPPMTDTEIVDEVEWLMNLGTGRFEAAAQVGETVAHVAALARSQGRTALARRVSGEPVTVGPGVSWARRWLYGQERRNAA